MATEDSQSKLVVLGVSGGIAAYRSCELARLLVKAGAKSTAKNDKGETPLHAAAAWGHTEVAGALLAGGADVDARDGQGRTPLALAAGRGHEEMAELLRQHRGTQ